MQISNNGQRIQFFLFVIIIALHHIFIWVLQSQFLYETSLTSKPVFEFVLSQSLAGCALLFLARRIESIPAEDMVMWVIIVSGFIFRIMMFGTQPIMEIDFYRYLWDGAVLWNGFNPYQWAPDQIFENSAEPLRQLAVDAGYVFERINYPHYITIYPPVAQLAFSLAHLIDPWSIDGLRWVLLGAECITLILILKVLRYLHRAKLWVAVYWLNPLVIKEIMNSAHMDGLLIPFLTLAVLTIVSKRLWWATIVIAIAAAVKLWPLLLAPFIWSRLPTTRAKLQHFILLVGLTAFLLAPLLFTVLESNAGLVGFSSQWVRNSAFFPSLVSLIGLLPISDMGLQAGTIARLLIAILITTTTFILARNCTSNATCIKGITLVIAMLFLLSPAQYPWYFIWLVPCLCFYTCYPLLALSALLPLYYLYFELLSRGLESYHSSIIVWFEYLPVLIMLLVQLRRESTGRTSKNICVTH